jgi:hypothetical protein
MEQVFFTSAEHDWCYWLSILVGDNIFKVWWVIIEFVGGCDGASSYHPI